MKIYILTLECCIEVFASKKAQIEIFMIFLEKRSLILCEEINYTNQNRLALKGHNDVKVRQAGLQIIEMMVINFLWRLDGALQWDSRVQWLSSWDQN